jgi:hypothetical protein
VKIKTARRLNRQEEMLAFRNCVKAVSDAPLA